MLGIAGATGCILPSKPPPRVAHPAYPIGPIPQRRSGSGLHVGAASIDITPPRGSEVWLAGYGFHAAAIVHPAGSPTARALMEELGSLVPAERRASACIIEIVPEGRFLTYGLGVTLREMRDPAAATARVSVSDEGGESG